MRRREFITLLGSAATAGPLTVRAQQPGRMRLIGVLMSYAESDPAAQSDFAAFRGALTKLGWTEGSDLRIELRWGGADQDTVNKFAKELVDLRPDAILSVTQAVTSALARETRTIPIVFAVVSDPIGGGLAASLAHPGGNITGFTYVDPAVGGKWVELLKEVEPRTARVALLFNPATAVPLQFFMPSIQSAASSFAVQATAAPVHGKDEIEGVIAAQARDQGGGLIALPDPFIAINREHLTSLAARYRVPAMYYRREFAEAGGLISYANDFAEQFPQAAAYVDRILKGAKPQDLPVQAPTKFDLIINLKTAKSLGLEVPFNMQQRADALIE